MRWAREDLLLAEHTARDPDVVACGVCMWAQQSAEKALEALVMAQGIDPPKTHNLLHLERLAPSSIGDQLASIDLVSLTHWAIEGRYPGRGHCRRRRGSAGRRSGRPSSR
ncbi:MAG: HEPN domain-containing protein [Pseudonocardiaceae bacterium]